MKEAIKRKINQNHRKTNIFSMMVLVARRQRWLLVSISPPSPNCLQMHMVNLMKKQNRNDQEWDIPVLFVHHLGNICFRNLTSCFTSRVQPMSRNFPERKTWNKMMLRTQLTKLRNRQKTYPNAYFCNGFYKVNILTPMRSPYARWFYFG